MTVHESFKNNGTYESTVEGSIEGKSLNEAVEGKWNVKDGVLTQEITKSNDPEGAPVGTVSHSPLTRVTDKVYCTCVGSGPELLHTREVK